MKTYDYLIVGAGFFGAVFAYEAKKRGKSVLVIDKNDHIGGNCYTKRIENIDVHVYGPHIFHCSNERIWNYINQFSAFNNYLNTPLAYYHGKLYNLPFNMHTFNQLWGIVKPFEAKRKIAEQKLVLDREPANLEEMALSLVGTDVYETLIKGYTEKQWGKCCKDLPASIIKRLPVRFIYDNNYFNDFYQGIPVAGYTKIFEQLLDGVEVILNSDYFDKRDYYNKIAEKIVYTGPIDRFFDYQFGKLEYRSLHFDHQLLDEENYQGIAVMNFTDSGVPYTRIIEHKHFYKANTSKTIITKEYPVDWDETRKAYYPVNDDKNQLLYKKYERLALKEKKCIFGGRLAQYKYFDMHQVIEAALTSVEEI